MMRATFDADALQRAIYAAAGLLQAKAAAAPPKSQGSPIREDDLQIALASSLQAQVGARVQRELSFSGKFDLLTKGRYGAIDVAVLASDGEGYDALVEGKCCSEDKLFETLWDAIKLAQLASKYGTNCYLVCAAPVAGWQEGEGRPIELFEPGDHKTLSLLIAYEAGWNKLLTGGGARPRYFPAAFSSHTGPRIPIHVFEGGDWEIRSSEIRVRDPEDLIEMTDSGWPSGYRPRELR